MSKRKQRRKPTGENNAEAVAADDALPASDFRIDAQPPKKNLPLLIVAGVLLFGWLAYLATVAVVSNSQG